MAVCIIERDGSHRKLWKHDNIAATCATVHGCDEGEAAPDHLAPSLAGHISYKHSEHRPTLEITQQLIHQLVTNLKRS